MKKPTSKSKGAASALQNLERLADRSLTLAVTRASGEEAIVHARQGKWAEDPNEPSGCPSPGERLKLRGMAKLLRELASEFDRRSLVGLDELLKGLVDAHR